MSRRLPTKDPSNGLAGQGALPIGLPPAKRRTQAVVVHIPVGEGVQPMSFRPPLELHSALRQHSLATGMSMQRIIETALRDYFTRLPAAQ
ncbi:MAG: hypothetical protein ACJ8AW_09645 [Rhodopila sp.]|jgi:hypothetical protein